MFHSNIYHNNIPDLLGSLAESITSCGITVLWVSLASFLATRLVLLFPALQKKFSFKGVVWRASVATFIILFPLDIVIGDPFRRLYLHLDLAMMLISAVLLAAFAGIHVYRFFMRLWRKTKANASGRRIDEMK